MADPAVRIDGLDDDPARPRLGEMLVAGGAAERRRVDAALAAQAETGARIGVILSARGWASDAAVAAAAARQTGLDVADLSRAPLDPDLLDPSDLETCLRRRLAPWRRLGRDLAWIGLDPASAAEGLAQMADPPDRARLALCGPADFERAMAAAHGGSLAERAAGRTPADLSARRRTGPNAVARGLALLGLIGAGMAAALWPSQVASIAFIALVLLNALNGFLRIAAFGAALSDRSSSRLATGATALSDWRPPPKVTLLIPLFREPETVPVLLHALEALDWPPELLDVKLILEEGDDATKQALVSHAPPPFCRIVTAPAGPPRTKPRALNYALDFAEGDIVGIYDAEDQPEPDQIRRAVAALAEHPPEVAAVQARLSYFNPRDSWLTRCFTLEYALWFDVLLRGYRTLGLPIPLGGTSVFFRGVR